MVTAGFTISVELYAHLIEKLISGTQDEMRRRIDFWCIAQYWNCIAQ
jgi:hypothetical protein